MGDPLLNRLKENALLQCIQVLMVCGELEAVIFEPRIVEQCDRPFANVTCIRRQAKRRKSRML